MGIVAYYMLCILPQVSEHVLSLGAPNSQAVRLLLAALNHLRGRQLDALQRGSKASGDAANAGEMDPTLWRKVSFAQCLRLGVLCDFRQLRTNKSRQLCCWGFLIKALPWLQVYWLDLDYLKVAQAAVQVNCLQHCMDFQGGSLCSTEQLVASPFVQGRVRVSRGRQEKS